jgi:hypothetical protein
MTTAYTSLLGLALPVTGELSGTWGDTVNNYITQYLDASIAGTNTISADADVTLVRTTNASLGGTSSQYAVILWTAAGTATRTIIAPAASSGSRQTYIVVNKSTTQSIKLCGAGPTTGVTLLPSSAAVCVWSGTDFTQVGGGLPSGGIIMWSGSIASIPSGWYLCDGTNGTPNLRDRFVVGAGTTYAVAATGGSADAIVVSHTHTVTDPGHGHGVGAFVQVPFGTGGGNDPGRPGNTTSAISEIKTTGVTIASAGASGTNANLPPYYALAYIMKA